MEAASLRPGDPVALPASSGWSPEPFSPLPAPLCTQAGNKRNAQRRRSLGKKERKKKEEPEQWERGKESP